MCEYCVLEHIRRIKWWNDGKRDAILKAASKVGHVIGKFGWSSLN